MVAVHNQALAEMDAEYELLSANGEVDDVGVHRVHAREPGRVPRQAGLNVAVAGPDVGEAHLEVQRPLPPVDTRLALATPHPHGRCFAISFSDDDLDEA